MGKTKQGLDKFWTPVSDKLPPENKFVLGYGKNIGRHINAPPIDVCLFDGDWWVEGGTEIISPGQKITHWADIIKP